MPPYFSGNKEELFSNIMGGPLWLPRGLSSEAKNLIIGLLNRNPTKRPGSGPDGALEIMRHPFFKGLNWEDILNRKSNPPLPKTRSEDYNN